MGRNFGGFFNPWAKSLPAITAVMLLILITVCGGCGSIYQTFDSESHSLGDEGFYKNKIYVGVRDHFDSRFPSLYLSHFLFALVDIPLSFIADTVLLPYTIPVTIKNLSEAKPVDAICFLLEGNSTLLLSAEGKRLLHAFNESDRCRMASRWREDEWDVEHAVISVTQLESIGRFYDAIMPFVGMGRDSRPNNEGSIRYYNGGSDGLRESSIRLVQSPGEKQVHEPYVLWTEHEEKATQMKSLIPQVGGTITKEVYSMSDYWPNLSAFEFTDPMGTRFQVVFRAKGPHSRWVD